MSFSGGTYDEVARWPWNFLTAHAKRVDPRIEVTVDAEDEEGGAYRAQLRLGARQSTPLQLEYREVAANRGHLGWCAALAARTQQLVREELVIGAPSAAG